MVTPSLCGSFLSDKRSMVAFTWSVTTVLTLFSFFVAVVLTVQIHTHYHRLERYYQTDDWYNYYNGENNKDDQDEDGASQDNNDRGSADRIAQEYILLANMSARSISFVACFTMLLSVALSLYGSMAIVGFTSLRGVYIAPCFSTGSDTMRVGIFGGAIVMFANLLLVCAVVLGEVRVEDYKDGRDREEMEPYQVERIATVLAVTCMFLAALYTVFAVLLFLCYASEEVLAQGVQEHRRDPSGVNHHHHHHHPKPLVSVSTTGDGHHMDGPGFITMEGSS